MDDIDRANDLAEMERSSAQANRQQVEFSFNPGDCDECGEFNAYLIHGVCTPCRYEAEKSINRHS
jgi:hypothetical protein